MLAKLSIKNVALIDLAEISFSEGLNVLSGETGAGKSVILDSVNFVLGAKAERTMIRYGETECMVKAEFIVEENSKAVQVLRELDIDSDGEIIISRKFTDAGKSSIKINGNTVTVSMLRSVTDHLVDVHGQSEHFYLLKESNQLRTLDEVIGEELKEYKHKLCEKLNSLKEINEQISLLGGNEQERNRRIELLKYQIDEITLADLKEGEEDELLLKRAKINNLEKIISALRETANLFSSDRGVLDGIRTARRSISSISTLDTEYSNLLDRIESLSMDADDIAQSLFDACDCLYFDENEMQEVENRLDLIHTLKRKYGANEREIFKYLETISNEYELLSDCEGKYEQLTSKKDKTEKNIYSICLEITKIRKLRGAEFCERVTNELKTLNINSAKFEIEFNDYSLSDVSKANTNGLDDIRFLFSANAGEPLKPLGKIISGGEMSRFMLAIKTQFSALNEISSYIFDEIDAGISGKTAKVVGEKFAQIAKNTQIIAVSHLAQIAVMSDKEFLIEKYEATEKTHTKVLELNHQEKLKEIVRLLGGSEKDDFAVKHAEELIRQADEYKRSIS
ncbi:MAG: DNA repair protein RecN [Clostridiales bacterium]|nr:DNA repair protein RecN [Clostridiales bacterium]